MQHKLDCCAKNSQLVTAYLSVKIKGEIQLIQLISGRCKREKKNHYNNNEL